MSVVTARVRHQAGRADPFQPSGLSLRDDPIVGSSAAVYLDGDWMVTGHAPSPSPPSKAAVLERRAPSAPSLVSALAFVDRCLAFKNVTRHAHDKLARSNETLAHCGAECEIRPWHVRHWFRCLRLEAAAP